MEDTNLDFHPAVVTMDIPRVQSILYLQLLHTIVVEVVALLLILKNLKMVLEGPGTPL